VGTGKLLTVITQAISRIAHEHSETKINIQRLVANETKHFPHHVLWLLAALRSSAADSSRKTACSNVLQHVRDTGSAAMLDTLTAHECLCCELEVRDGLGGGQRLDGRCAGV